MGIPANCNRGVKASKGEWIKLIAGDDILMKNCISVNYYHAKKTNKAMYYSELYVFANNGYLKRITDNYNKVSKWFGKKNQLKMKKSYLRYPIMINVPTFFINSEVLNNLGYFDEQFKLLEDQPFLIKLLLNNYEIEFIAVTTVKYRHYESSVMNSSSNQFVKNLFDCYMNFARPNLKNNNLKDIIFRSYRDYCFKIIMTDKRMNYFESNVYRLKNIIYRFS
jgi:alpha-1,3-rhamnosyltransferase